MLFRMLWLWTFAAAAKDLEVEQQTVGLCVEYPEDPREYLADGNARLYHTRTHIHTQPCKYHTDMHL